MLSADFFFGIIFFQLLFIGTQWSIFKRQEYGWYVLYIVCISLYFALKYLSDTQNDIEIGDYEFDELAPDKSLSFLAFGIYIKFGRKFLGTKQSSPHLDRWIILLETAIISYSVLNFIFIVSTHNYIIEGYAFAGAFGIAFIASMILLFFLYQNNKYSKYLIIGSSMVAVGGCAALYTGLMKPNLGIGTNDTSVFLQVGVIADFIFLNIGLVVKTRLLQLREVESQRLIEQERLRISSELHDDLGGGLSTIRLLSEIMKERTTDHLVSQQLIKISDSSKELVQKMNEIVWALNINNDNLPSLLAYIRQYTVKMLDDVGITCTINMPEQIALNTIAGNERRNIFLMVKECVHNIIKHSKATQVHVQLSISENIYIQIHDNGTGFCNNENHVNHFGLHNLQERAKALEGKIEWHQNHGTMVQIKIPLKSILHKSVIS